MNMMSKAFRVSDDYLDWAHSSAAEESQPRALRLFQQPLRGDARYIECPELVAEIADVAELYVGGGDSDLRAARVRARAIEWLRDRGFTVKQALQSEPCTGGSI